VADLCDPLTMRAIPELFYIKRLLLLLFTFTFYIFLYRINHRRVEAWYYAQSRLFVCVSCVSSNILKVLETLIAVSRQQRQEAKVIWRRPH